MLEDFRDIFYPPDSSWLGVLSTCSSLHIPILLLLLFSLLFPIIMQLLTKTKSLISEYTVANVLTLLLYRLKQKIITCAVRRLTSETDKDGCHLSFDFWVKSMVIMVYTAQDMKVFYGLGTRHNRKC